MPANIGYLTARTDKASDEVYTPASAVLPIVKYVDMLGIPSTVWCPFDTEESEYVKLLRRAGHKVIATHIDNEQNFFYYEPEEDYDCIVSNPPFSIKDDVLKRLYELNKPYAMLLPVPVIQGQRRFDYIKDCQILAFDKRVNYYTDVSRKEVQKGVSFGSLYLCRRFLPQDLIFEKLEEMV